GNARVDDPATPNSGVGPLPYVDRGAYEFQPSGAPPPDAAPAAAVTVAPSSGRAPLTVTADASGSTDGDATPIASYAFAFGDGSPVVGPQSGTTSPHVYTVPGTYTVTLTVADSGGLSSVATAQAAVTDNPPTARMTVQVSGLTVTADATASTDDDATGISSY